jgi:hypothetical protein
MLNTTRNFNERRWRGTFLVLLLMLIAHLSMAQYKVVGYMPSWAGTSTQIQYNKITHINYSFIRPTTTGGLTAVDQPTKLQDIVSRAHAAGVKVGMAVGGWSDLNNTDFQSTAANGNYRTAFINNLINLINQYGLDGIDIDWEYPREGSDPDNYATMMSELATALHARGKYLTAAVSASGYYADGVQPGVFNSVDWLNIMVYDGGDGAAHSPYSYAVSSLDYWAGRGLPANKTVLGVPFYARPGFASYATLLGQGADPYADVFNGAYYNGINTIKQKTNLTFDRSLGGIMFWELSQDVNTQFSLVTAIKEVVDLRSGGNPPPTVSITSPASGATFNAPASITINANASDNVSVSKVDFYNGSTLLGTDTSSPYSFTWSNVGAGTYSLTAKATDNQSASTTSSAVSVTVTTPAVQSPYGGTVRNIPGKIEAEHYDLGGEGVAYHDLTTGNSGNAFRTDNVDLEATTDTGTGYNVGWIQAGEWLEYSVNITTAGTYTLSARVATTAAGKTFHVEMNGVNVSGTLTVPNTTGWQIWQTVTATTTSLTTGQKIMRIYADQGDFNINYVDFTTSGNPAPTTSITSPAGGATFTAPASITINATATDNVSVAKVDFYNGTTLLGTDTSSPYSFTWSSVAVGTYSLTTKATDNQGAVGTSAAVSVTVNNGTNSPPVTAIQYPGNGANFTAPANITITAVASDASPGNVTKVDFYSGANLLGTATTSPYGFVWNNVPAGTYTLTTKATDNQGAVGTSSPVTINVAGTSNCSGKPQYVENGGYVDGSQVKNIGNIYQCKPYPFTGWCNGAAWAYAPGTGSYWSDAWTLIGACPARSAQPEGEEVVLTEEDGLFLAPNPGVSGRTHTITLSFAKEAGNVKVHLINMSGTSVQSSNHDNVKHTLNVEMPALSNGLYIIKVQGAKQSWSRKYVVEQGN